MSDVTRKISKELRLEIAHVLFIDIVGYSKLLIDEQSETLQELNQIVRKTDSARAAEAAGQLVLLPTGDGMALVFTGSVEDPVECALQISQALRAQPSLPVRMGIHSGPVHHVVDVNNRENIAGAGINTAQRVMDCGDAGHILVSKRVADDLAQYRRWQPYLHELGDFEVKHGGVVSVVNFYADVVGNPEPPAKFRKLIPAGAPIRATKIRAIPWHEVALAGLLIAGLIVAGVFFFRHRAPQQTAAAPNASPLTAIGGAIPEKSIAVLPFENRSEEKANAYFADGIQDEILTRLSKIADLKVTSRTSTQHYKSTPENLSEVGKQLGVAHILEGSVQKANDAVRVNVQLIKAANDSHLWADTFDRKLTDIFSVESDISKAVADQLQARLSGQEEQVIAAKPTNNPEAYDAYLRGLAYTLKGSNSAVDLGAQKHLKEAVRLDPKFALAWALLAIVDGRGYNTADLQPTVGLREETRQAAETALALQPNLGEAVLAMGYYYYNCLRDNDTAVRYFEQAGSFLKEQPDNVPLIGVLALTDMALGDKTAALSLSERAMATMPIEKSASGGPLAIEILARVAAGVGEPDRSIAALEKLLSIPYSGALAENVPLTPALLRLDPMFDPLRNDPRFQKLCESPETK
jgi:TolB-like protein/class 3 adenylate cyclase